VTIPKKADGKWHCEQLRTFAAPAGTAAATQVVRLAEELGAQEVEIQRTEGRANHLVFELYGLSRVERELIGTALHSSHINADPEVNSMRGFYTERKYCGVTKDMQRILLAGPIALAGTVTRAPAAAAGWSWGDEVPDKLIYAAKEMMADVG
jgi:hypothetical protein